MEDVSLVDIETYIIPNPGKPWLIVRVDTDAGVTGLAEATLHGKPKTVSAAFDEMSRYYLGKNPFNTEELFLEMYRDEIYSDNVVNTSVISAIDVACWDIKAKILDLPLYKLLGGDLHGNSLRTYANGWYSNSHDKPKEFAEAASQVISKGYDALKFDPFGDIWMTSKRKTINKAIDRVSEVRKSVGGDIDILIEGHGRFTPGQAVEIEDELRKYNITWLEEPTPPDSVEGLRKVAAKSTTPIATGERRMSKYPFRDILARTDVDILQPDLANAGGITEGKKIAALAEAEHVKFAPHNAQGPVATAMYAHLCSTIPNFMIQEVFVDNDWATELLRDPLVIEDGELMIPEGPGLGIELDLDVIKDISNSEGNVEHAQLYERE